MLISEKKTKSMIFNFTHNWQFQTGMTINESNIEVVDKILILGTTFTNNLTWTENCDILIKKVNARVRLLRKLWSFGSSREKNVHLWKVYCLSVLKRSCMVWDSGLTLNTKQSYFFNALRQIVNFSTYLFCWTTFGQKSFWFWTSLLTCDM